jgi:flagellin-like hook-associated protein FlgL
MNNDRRDRIAAISAALEDLSAKLGELRDEEQEAFDNTPESIQGGERGQAMETAIDTLDDAQTSVDDVVSELGGIE